MTEASLPSSQMNSLSSALLIWCLLILTGSESFSQASRTSVEKEPSNFSLVEKRERTREYCFGVYLDLER